MTKQLPWFAKVEPGSLIARGRMPPRTVRSVSYKGGQLHSVALSILNCSWTGRCYTVLMASDLIQMKYRLVSGKLSLKQQIDQDIEWCITHHEKRQQKLDCCDVKGIR